MTHVYQRGDLSATLILGDCRTMSLAADAVITDPPYGMNWDTDSSRFSRGKRRVHRGDGRADYGAVIGDDQPFDPAPWLGYKSVVLWGANHYAQKLPTGATLVWVKVGQPSWGKWLSDAEIAWMKNAHGVWLKEILWKPTHRAKDRGAVDLARVTGVHPTQKPVALMAWCLDKARVPRGATVLDPYMGSGTTAIACLRTGRNFLGVEIDPRYYETARARVAREAAQTELELPEDLTRSRGDAETHPILPEILSQKNSGRK